MYSSNDRMAIRRARVDFSRTGWQQFAKLNRKLGKRFLQAFILRNELAAYLTAYEAAGVQLDTECQEVRYDDGVYANPVEFGHGGPAPAPAHPFVRPAYDTRADEAYAIIREGLQDAIDNL